MDGGASRSASVSASNSQPHFQEAEEPEGPQEDYEIPETQQPEISNSAPAPSFVNSALFRELSQIGKEAQKKKRSNAKSPPPVTTPKPILEEEYEYSDNTTRGFVPPTSANNHSAGAFQEQYADRPLANNQYDAAETARIPNDDDENIYQNWSASS